MTVWHRPPAQAPRVWVEALYPQIPHRRPSPGGPCSNRGHGQPRGDQGRCMCAQGITSTQGSLTVSRPSDQASRHADSDLPTKGPVQNRIPTRSLPDSSCLEGLSS